MPEEKSTTEEIIFSDIDDLSGTNSQSIADSPQDEREGVNTKFLKNAEAHFTRLDTKVKPHRDFQVVADAMYKAMQNASVRTTEDAKGANLSSHLDSVPVRSNNGSPLFHRFVNQLTGQYMAVYLSKPMPWKYDPIVNENVPESAEEALPDSEVWNLYAKWTLKRNKDGVTTHDAVNYGYKYGNVVEAVFWEKENVRGPSGDLDLGHTSFQQIPLRNIWFDPDGGKIEHQHFVATCTPRPASYVLKMVKNGYYDAEQVKKVNRTHLWDGTLGAQTDDEQTSSGLDTTSASDTGMVLEWHVYMLFPVEQKKYKPGAIPAYWHGVALGNELNNSAVLVALEPNQDPDGEIPMHITPALPDDPNLALHVSPAQIIRGHFASVTTLIRQIVDEGTQSLLAPDIIRKDAFIHGTAFQWDGNPWFCNGDPTKAMDRPAVGNASQLALQLIEYLEENSGKALNLDKSFQGESFGARTSSQEAGNIFRSSAQPILAQIRYMMQNREGWRARKIMSYGDKFAKKEILFQITDDAGTVQQFELTGTMNRAVDIEVNIVDEFENKIVMKQALNEKVQAIAASPVLSQEANIPEIMREWFEADKLSTGRLIRPRQDLDAESIADFENQLMLRGESIAPVPGQNDQLHILRHQAFRLRWGGFAPEDQERLQAEGVNPVFFELIDLHIQQHQLNLQASQQGGTPLPQGQRNQSEGEAVGNTAAAFQGAALGGRR